MQATSLRLHCAARECPILVIGQAQVAQWFFVSAPHSLPGSAANRILTRTALSRIMDLEGSPALSRTMPTVSVDTRVLCGAGEPSAFSALLTSSNGSAMLMAKREGCDGFPTGASMGEEPGSLFCMVRLTYGRMSTILMMEAGLVAGTAALRIDMLSGLLPFSVPGGLSRMVMCVRPQEGFSPGGLLLGMFSVIMSSA